MVHTSVPTCCDVCLFFLMRRRPPRSTQSRSSAASDVYKRQHQGKTGTDVVECRSNCRKVGDKIEVIQRDQQHGKGKNKNVDAHVNICGADNLVLDRLAVNLDAAYTPGMQQLDQFFFYRFQ